MPPVFGETPPPGPPTQAWGTRTSGQPTPPPAEPEPTRRNLIPWIALAVVVVAGIAAALVLLLGGGDDGEQADDDTTTESSDDTSDTTGPGGELSAEQTVEAYFTALGERDCEALIDYVSEDSWSEGGSVTRDDALAGCEDEQANAPTYELDDLAVTEGGGEGDDTAVVDATVTADDETTSVPIGLVREDGTWRLDFT